MESFNRRSLIKAAAVLGGLSTIADFGDGMLAQTSTQSATTTRELDQRKEGIAKTAYTKEHAALLIVDPYNDFMSEGGKLFERTKETAMTVGFYDNMRRLIPAARAAGLRVFILPHHRFVEGDYNDWLAVNPSQEHGKTLKPFAVGTWGGEWHPEFGPRPGDIIIKEHWAQSSFANTDLDQQLKQHGIQKIILVGFIANTCIESTGRYGMELGYHVTLVRDATAAYSKEAMHAAHEVNGPTYAHALVTTSELIALLPNAKKESADLQAPKER
jgi:nicotinamidase-related amidase